jgi:hypothetical protein
MIGFWDCNSGNVQRRCIVDTTRMLETTIIRSKQSWGIVLGTYKLGSVVEKTISI